MTPVPVSTHHSCDQGDHLTAVSLSRVGAAAVGFGAVALGSQVGKARGNTQALTRRIAPPSSPSPRAGGASAAAVTEGEAGP